jgi:hypothetical protein
MTLKEQVQQALAAMPQFSLGEQSLEVGDGPLHLRCELAALDSLACAFNRLALRSDRVAAMSADELKKCAADLSAKLTYLLEPISPIETDAHGCVVQLRSHPPQKEDDRTSYYELLVSRSGELSLVRYSRAAGQSRQIIPTHVTREVLSRLVGDFASVAS